MYGKHWYTNVDTGESVCAIAKPSERYIQGKNVLHGQTSSIYQQLKNNDWRVRCQHLWDEYHASTYSCVSEFGAAKGIIELRRKFRRYIPIFANMSKSTKHNRNKLMPNRSLIGKYF